MRIGQFGKPRGRPGDAAIVRVRGTDPSRLVRSRIQAEVVAFHLYDAGLNDPAFRWHDGAVPSPALSVIRAALDPACPGFLALHRRAADDQAAREYQRFRPDRAV